jgi:hypothetical protein
MLLLCVIMLVVRRSGQVSASGVANLKVVHASCFRPSRGQPQGGIKLGPPSPTLTSYASILLHVPCKPCCCQLAERTG